MTTNPIYPPEGVTLPPEPVEKEYEDCTTDKERLQWRLEFMGFEDVCREAIQLEHDIAFLERQINELKAAKSRAEWASSR